MHSIWVIRLITSFFSLLWIKTAVPGILLRKKRVFAKNLPVPSQLTHLPFVSVVVPARNEHTALANVFETLLNQDYPQFEVIAVNDRSTDQSAQLLDQLKQKYPHLIVKHLTSLQEGWLGKTHALQKGVEVAKGDWLLFTDADTKWAPSLITRVMSYMLRDKIDYASMNFEVLSQKWGERVFIVALYSLGLVLRKWWFVPDSSRKECVGIGQFQLFKKHDLEKIGSLESIRLSIPEDVNLAKAFKFHRYTCRFISGEGALACKWQEGLWGYIRGIEKNFFASLDFSFCQVALTAGLSLGLAIGPYLGLASGILYRSTFLILVNATGLAALVILAKLYLRNVKIRWYEFLSLPVGILFVLFAMFRSAIKTSIQKGVCWRDVFYSKELLRTFSCQNRARLEKIWESKAPL